MQKLEIAKTLASAVVAASVSKVVSTIVKNNTDVESTTDKIAVVTSSYVLGAMVADRAKDYTDARIDEAAKWYREHIKKDA
jgi:hypothetical protein